MRLLYKQQQYVIRHVSLILFSKKLLNVNKIFLTMSSKKVSDKPKLSRKLLTIEQKKEIISAHEDGARIVDLAIKHGISSSSIATILKKKEEIKAASVAVGVKTLASQFQRSFLNEEMEKLLIVWIKERQKAGDTLTQKMICSTARTIYKNLKEHFAGSSSVDAEKEFKGSRGWFVKFKRRSGIHNVIKNEEGASANEEEAEKLARIFQNFSVMYGYNPEQIINCDETELLWKQLTPLFCVNDLKIKDGQTSSDEEEDSNENIPTEEIKKLLHYWEEFQSLATKWHPNKDETNKLCASVEDTCLNHFKDILRKREAQSTLDKFSPPIKRQKPEPDTETDEYNM